MELNDVAVLTLVAFLVAVGLVITITQTAVSTFTPANVELGPANLLGDTVVWMAVFFVVGGLTVLYFAFKGGEE